MISWNLIRKYYEEFRTRVITVVAWYCPFAICDPDIASVTNINEDMNDRRLFTGELHSRRVIALAIGSFKSCHDIVDKGFGAASEIRPNIDT
mgnify:CR=1 FL=1